MTGAKAGSVLAAGLLLGVTLIVACGDGGDQAAVSVTGEPRETRPTATAEKPTATVVEEGTPTSDGYPGYPSEVGEAPVFWRTEDEFESLRAGEPYKVLVRVTNGYEEDTLVIRAGCLTCAQEGVVVEIEAVRAEPEREEAPGSYYPFSLELPQPGAWRVTVLAGDDEVSIAVQAEPPGSSAG